MSGPVKSEKLRVLIFGGREDDVKLELLALQAAGCGLHWRRVEDLAEIGAALASEAWDLVLSNHEWPDLDWLEAVHVLRDRDADIPLIRISASASDEATAISIRHGAAECISKNDLGSLGASVKIHLREAENRRARKTAEADPRESEGLFAEAFEHSPIGTALVDLDGTFSRVNFAFARLLGYAEPAELVGVSFASLTHPDDAATGVAAMRVILEQEKPYQAEKRYIRTDGTVVDVLLSVVLVRDSGGRAAKFFTQVEDITERKTAESEYADLAAIVECSQDAIIGKDRCGVITVWNPAAERLYGYAASEAIGRPVSLLVPVARRNEDRELLDRGLGGGRLEHYQTERVCKDGSVVNVSLSVSPIHDSAGRVTGASSIARDVTGLMRAQEQIALQAELLDEVDAAVIVSSAAGVVRYWSRGAQQLYGYSREEAVDCQLLDLIFPIASRSEIRERRAGAIAGSAAEGEIDARDKQRRVFPVYYRLHSVRLHDRDGESDAIVSVSVDISARRNAEQAVRRYAEGHQEIASLGRLALKGEPLEELFDCAVGAAWRVLSSDCAWLVQCSPDSPDPVLTVEVGWADQKHGEPIVGEARSLSGYAARSHGSVVVEDWDQEPRFAPSSQRRARGVRSSAGVLVGDPTSPFGVLEVQYTEAGAVPADCLPFLHALANVLGEAIQSQHAQETVSQQSRSLAVMADSLRDLVSEKERLIEQIPGVVIAGEVHADGSVRLAFVSRQCETILGVAPPELLGDSSRFLQYVHPDDRELLRTSVTEPAAFEVDQPPVEFRFNCPNGREVWLRGVSALVHAEDHSQRVQSVLFDITAAKQAALERERLELDLRLAQKLEAVGQLAAGVAHEINTPVQFIGNSVTFLKRAADKLLTLTSVYHELLHSDQPIDKEERQLRAALAEEDVELDYLIERIPPAFDRALDGIERVSSIVRAMREFAHHSADRAPIDVNDGIQTTLIVARNEYKYVADIELELGDLPLVMANAGDLNQVFLNLIVNASHAIEARVQDTEQRGTITVRTEADDAAVLISVSDTGCGIPADVAGRVFDPFFTTKPVGRGTGQGLAIAHTIVVERHHGAISFEPNPGGGTTFRVLLPRDEPAADDENLQTAA